MTVQELSLIGVGVALAASIEALRRVRRRVAAANKSLKAEIEARQQATEQKQRILETTLAYLSDFAYIFGPDGRFLFANQPLLNLWGTTPEEAFGKNFFELGYPDDLAAKLQRQVQEVFESGQSITDETPYTSPSGLNGHYEYIFSPAFAVDGTVDFVVGTSRDVSERKLAQDALRQSEEMLRLITNLVPHGIFAKDSAGRHIFANEALAEMASLSVEEMLGKDDLDLVTDKAQAEAYRAHDRLVIQSGARMFIPEEARTDLSGRTRYLQTIKIPFTLAKTGEPAVLGVCIDITGQRLMKKLLEESEGRYRALVEWSPESISVQRDGKIIYANPAAIRMMGAKSEEDLVGMSSLDLVHPDFREFVRERLRNSTEHGVALPMIEETLIKLDGTVIEVEVQGIPIIYDGEPALYGSMRDVTKRNEAERQSRQLEIKVAESEAASKAKSLFLSTMSHEIRTPMNAILGYSQLMLRDPRLGADTKANLEIVNRSGEHLLDIINDVLDLAKIEAGRLRLSPKPFDPRPLVRVLESMFRLRAEAKALQFEVLVTGEPVSIVADEGKIRQVLINLLANAVKFTKAGSVSMNVQLTAGADNGLRFVADVEDTGIGMTPEEVSELFQPFAQGQSGQGIDNGGTGLGLAISLGIARLMGGDITVKSRPGSGSVFRFDVPAERGDNRDMNEADLRGRISGIEPGQEAPRILIADDLPDNREWLSRLLVSIGFPVRSADNGMAAVLAWEEWRPQLVLMDMHMPVMNGLEAARRIRSLPAGKDTVIFALTADAMEAHRQVVFENDINDFISKPCMEGELLEKIGKHLGLAFTYEAAGHSSAPATSPVAGETGNMQGNMQGYMPTELSEDLVPHMREALITGNKALLDSVILTIEERGGGQSAPGLRKLADLYEYEKLMEWLENVAVR